MEEQGNGHDTLACRGLVLHPVCLHTTRGAPPYVLCLIASNHPPFFYLSQFSAQLAMVSVCGPGA